MYFVLFGLVYRPAMLRLLLPCCASPPAAFLARPAEGDTRPKARGKRSPPVGQRRVSQADGMDAVTGRSAPSSGMSADNEGELFDVVDENNQVVGQELRSVVHAKGLLHRAVYCFVFNSAGELLLQRRSQGKKIGPGQWDLSCAEHLQPGESYREGAQRGLGEELGITAQITSGPLGPTHQREYRAGDSFIDREFVESYRLDNYDGVFKCDEAEVMDAKFLPLEKIKELATANPDGFTAWFHAEMRLLGFL